MIRDVAHTYARADRAQICWTLGITEHHNAVDNVLALINLALLTGHVGRYGSGLNPLRGQNNVQGGGDMGAIPNRLPGFQDLETDPEAVAKYERAWGVKLKPKYGWHMTEMFEKVGEGELTTMFVLGENPVQSDADSHHVRKLLESLDHLVVQDIFRTATAELADVVLPASASWCEAEGTVTSSERRVQRVRAALKPPGNARDDVRIIVDLAARLGHSLGVRLVRGRLERAPLPGAEPRRHELRPARGARRDPVAVLRRGVRSARASCTAACGRSRWKGRRPCSTRSRTRRPRRPSRTSSRSA